MFDEAKARRAVEFISLLRHTKGKFHGQPFSLLPWQLRIVRDLFGTVNPDGSRQYRTAYIEVPKKNGKSELAAAIALKMLCADGEQRDRVGPSERQPDGDRRGRAREEQTPVEQQAQDAAPGAALGQPLEELAVDRGPQPVLLLEIPFVRGQGLAGRELQLHRHPPLRRHPAGLRIPPGADRFDGHFLPVDSLLAARTILNRV